MRKKLAIQDGATHVSVYPVGTTIAGGEKCWNKINMDSDSEINCN